MNILLHKLHFRHEFNAFIEANALREKNLVDFVNTDYYSLDNLNSEIL